MRDICETRTTERRILRFNGSLSFRFPTGFQRSSFLCRGSETVDQPETYCVNAKWFEDVPKRISEFRCLDLFRRRRLLENRHVISKKTEKVEKFKGSVYNRGIQIKMQNEIYGKLCHLFVRT